MAVETALVSVILCTLLFGIIECSLLMKDWLAVSASARAGARMAVSEPRLAGFAQDAANQVSSSVADLTMSASDRLWVYKADTHGMPASGSFASCANPCVQFRWDPAARAFVNLGGSYDPLSQNACAGSAANDSIGVYLKVTHHPLTGWLFGNLTVAESTVMRLEPISSTGVCKP